MFGFLDVGQRPRAKWFRKTFLTLGSEPEVSGENARFPQRFTGAQVLALVLAESCLIAVLGGALGLGLAAVVIPALGKALATMLPMFYFPARDLLLEEGFINSGNIARTGVGSAVAPCGGKFVTCRGPPASCKLAATMLVLAFEPGPN